MEREVKRKKNDERYKRNEYDQVVNHVVGGVVAQDRVAVEADLKVVAFNRVVGDFLDFVQEFDLLG